MQKIVYGIAALALLVLGSTVAGQSALKADDHDKWIQAISQKLAKEFRYPRSAVRRGLEGRATVDLKLNADGSIKDFVITQKTGHRALDREIPKLVARINPLPKTPDNAAQTLELPLVWRLR